VTNRSDAPGSRLAPIISKRSKEIFDIFSQEPALRNGFEFVVWLGNSARIATPNIINAIIPAGTLSELISISLLNEETMVVALKQEDPSPGDVVTNQFTK
jgi:hypothetical protein